VESGAGHVDSPISLFDDAALPCIPATIHATPESFTIERTFFCDSRELGKRRA